MGRQAPRRGELAPVGVGGDEDPARLIDEAGQLGDAVYAVDVAVKAEGDDVAVLRVDLDAGDDGEGVAAGEIAHLVGLPREVVFGEADGIEPRRLGGLDELVGREEAIVRQRPGVGVEVDEHGFALPQLKSCGIERMAFLAGQGALFP